MQHGKEVREMGWVKCDGPTWTDADQEHFIKTEKEYLAKLLRDPATWRDPHDCSLAQAEELLVCSPVKDRAYQS
jgi:hypothetical protein